ncbi:MAG: hypothetical protein QQN44_07380 [Nitrosopumilus sp.]
MEILVKVSGDLQNEATFYKWLDSVVSPSNKLFILCGGGTAISEILEQHEIASTFGPNGREISSAKGKKLALEVLEKQRESLKNNLRKRKIIANVFTPVVKINRKHLHLNGDNFATALYPNFDAVFIVTKKGRVKSFPKEFSKVEVVYL